MCEAVSVNRDKNDSMLVLFLTRVPARQFRNAGNLSSFRQSIFVSQKIVFEHIYRYVRQAYFAFIQFKLVQTMNLKYFQCCCCCSTISRASEVKNIMEEQWEIVFSQNSP